MTEPQTFTVDDLPLIGEPIAIEFANSLYEGEETIDFLSSAKNVALWFRSAEGAKELYLPGQLTPKDLTRLRSLRSVLRALFAASIAKEPLSLSAVHSLNQFASSAPSYSMLVPRGDGFIVSTVASEPTLDGLLGRLAHEAIILLGENRALLRRCEAPGCPMMFLQDHHRRRWCHESCGHRSRQSAYYQRKKGKTR
jgi:predicted RNA-binding Zn ribbon-like protein